MPQKEKPKIKEKVIELIGMTAQINLIERLKKSNEHYILTKTAYSTKIKLPELKLAYLITPDYLAKRNWGILSSIKSEINKNELMNNLPKINTREIDYNKFRDDMRFKEGTPKGFSKVFNNIAEIDISAAYVNSAYNLGVIKKGNYDKLINGPKKNRLKILGALASRKTVEYWVGPDLINSEFISDEKNRNIWFNIVLNVDRAISAIYDLIGNRALFYYVDNIYFHHDKETEKIIISEFKKYGFQTKLILLESFLIYNARAGAVAVVKRPAEIKPKYFFIPNNKIIKYIIE